MSSGQPWGLCSTIRWLPVGLGDAERVPKRHDRDGRSISCARAQTRTSLSHRQRPSLAGAGTKRSTSSTEPSRRRMGGVLTQWKTRSPSFGPGKRELAAIQRRPTIATYGTTRLTGSSSDHPSIQRWVIRRGPGRRSNRPNAGPGSSKQALLPDGHHALERNQCTLSNRFRNFNDKL